MTVISFCILARDPIRVFFRRIGVNKVQVADEFFAYNSMDRKFKLTPFSATAVVSNSHIKDIDINNLPSYLPMIEKMNYKLKCFILYFSNPIETLTNKNHFVMPLLIFLDNIYNYM